MCTLSVQMGAVLPAALISDAPSKYDEWPLAVMCKCYSEKLTKKVDFCFSAGELAQTGGCPRMRSLCPPPVSPRPAGGERWATL